MNLQRKVEKVISGVKASDGDGVQLTRLIGSSQLDMLDPFLLLDAFGSDQPHDYLGGFPPHPHRGFETVTYMLAGKMRHEDSAGNAGVIEAGSVQWMHAARGIIHSEMPEQEEGLLAGFQLWVNLPAAQKMSPPDYQEISADDIPIEQRSPQCRLKIIAGETQQGTKGVIKNEWITPFYWDIELDEGGQFSDSIPEKHNAFIYVIEGVLQVADAKPVLQKKQLGVLSLGQHINIRAHTNSRFLLIAGKPINEAVARGGPFVMNTQEEIKQAFADYRSGNLA